MNSLISTILNSIKPGDTPPVDKTVPAPPAPDSSDVKVAPSLSEINAWNNYLSYFNGKVKADGVSDDQLDAGDGSYSKKLFNEWAASNNVNAPYEDMTKKMQDYYISLFNGADPLAASLVKSKYPKPMLSQVDGRVGSLTRNYYIPTMNYAKTVKDKSGEKTFSFKGVFNPYSENLIDVVHNSMLDENGNPMSKAQVAEFYKTYSKEKSSSKK